jgi:hypothetical protein
MAGEPFDLERLRQSWARAAAPPPNELPARLAAVKTPGDPYQEARAILAQIEALSLAQFPRREATLTHFLGEAKGLLATMERASSDAEPAGSKDFVAPDPRVRLMELLDELTEFLEVFATLDR